MDPVRVGTQVVVQRDGPVIELYFLTKTDLATYVAVPQEVDDRGYIVWKSEKVEEGMKAPVSLHLSLDLFEALKEAVVDMVPAASEMLIEVLQTQLTLERNRVEKLIDHGLR